MPPNAPGTPRGQPYRGGGPPREPTLDELWPQYLRGGYFDGTGNLRPEYVARDRMERLARAMNGIWPRSTKPTPQVRRFFQHCRALEGMLRSRASNWPAEYAKFLTLDRAAADAVGKSPPKIPRLFHDFIRQNVAAVRTEKDFLNGFLPHFEALVGFGAPIFRERERN